MEDVWDRRKGTVTLGFRLSKPDEERYHLVFCLGKITGEGSGRKSGFKNLRYLLDLQVGGVNGLLET